ncbi:MAG: DNRLRE domain-containing protein, partial [Saprospiraceae bacterium]|nr:DNRLRE domain-containing protein [Saprospiraceae bacterium]
MKSLNTSLCIGLYSNNCSYVVKETVKATLFWLAFAVFFILSNTIVAQTIIGPVNMGNLTDHLFVFTDANIKANWQGASKGFVGNVAIDGIQADETTSGTVPYAGTIFTNDNTLDAWQNIVNDNAGQASGSTGQTAKLAQLESQLNSAFSQINALSPSPNYNGVSSTSLNGLNTQNNITETFVINITSGLSFSSKINITGDATDVFILRWDSDGNPNNGYQGQVKPQSGGAIVPFGGLKPSNFINVAGDITSSGGGIPPGINPNSPYPQGPRLNNGYGALISGGSDFSGGGFFTGYWLTTGNPTDGKTSSLSNGIFVGGWYSRTTEFSMTSGTSGVYFSPSTNPCDVFQPTITGTNTVCNDNLVPTNLSVTGGVGTYLWSTGATTSSIMVTPSHNGSTYSVTVTSVDNCVKVLTKTIAVKPCTGQICFSGNNNVSATANWVITYAIDPANDKVLIRATLSKNFVDNTYGTNAIGWPGGHTFGNLVGSDHLILSMLDGNNVKKMETKLDYISTAPTPSGYDALGVTGGEGSMILGNSSDVLSATTSLDQNFNTYGYVLTTNSPATDANYTPNQTYPNWIYDVWYEVEVRLSVFGAAGFGKVGITGVHASPSKTGNNTEIVTEEPCPDPCDSFQPVITGTNSICNDNLVPTNLSVTGGVGTYLWSTGATTSSITVTPSVNGSTYTVTVTSMDTCIRVLTKTILVKPCSGQICFNGANGVGATANWTIIYTLDPVNDKVKIRATLSKNFVDNTYGTNTIGWDGGHTFGNLTGSDHLILAMLDGNNVKRMETKLDYLTSAPTPSGYDALGVTGGEGSMILGSSSDVLSATTSLDQNFNTYGYVLTTNSPATDANYTPNPTYPNWIYDVWYEVEVRLSAFGAAGFGKVGITGVHASPSKTGNNTEEVTEGPCCELAVNITGDNSNCAGESTQLTATYLSNTTLNINPIDDNYLYQKDAGENYGLCDELLVGSQSSTEKSRGILKFNLSSLPAGVNITSANLIMTKTGGSNTVASFGVHRITQPWTEGGGGCGGSITASSWNQRQSGTPWSSAGGDFNAAAESTTSVGNDAQYSWNIKNLVMGWQNGSITNNGVLIKMATEGSNNEKKFASFEDGDATIKPVLAISYLVPPTPGMSQYLWSNGATTSSINVNPMTTTTYTVTVSETGGCTGIKSIVVTVSPKPTVDAGVDPEICTGQTVVLTANGSGGTGPYTYGWNNPPSTGPSKQVSPTVNTTYSVTVTDSNGCTNTDNVSVIIGNPPVASAINDGPLTCTKTSVTLTANPATGVSYLWSTGAVTRTTTVNVQGTYTVTVTDLSSECSATASTTVTGNIDIPSVDAGPDKIICAGQSATLTAVGTGSLLWSTGATTASITVSPVVTTTYTVSVTGSNGCSASDAAMVTVNQPPNNSGISGNDVCVNEYGVFVANPPIPGATYLWTFDGGTSLDGDYDDISETVKWGIAYQNTFRNITLTITKDGCIFTYNKQIFVKQGPFLLTASDYDVCQGGAVQVGPNPNDPNQVTPGSSFLWTPNLFLNNNMVAQPISTPPFDITYTLTATINGCVESRQVNVDVNVNLNPIADAGPDKLICLGETVQIGGNPTATPPPGGAIQGVVWSPSTGLNNNLLHNPLATPTGNIQYQVIVVATSGCADTAFMNITLNPKPSIVATATPPSICLGSSSVLSATASGGTPGYTISWSNGLGNGSSKTVAPTINRTYTVTVTDSKGCTASTSVTVTVLPKPTVVVTVDPVAVCQGGNAQLTASPSGGTIPYTFLWSNGLGTGPVKNVSPASTTTYFVTVTDVNGCSATNSATLIVELKAKVGDFAWEDKNANGVQDVGEPGLGGISVTLFDAQSNILIDQTTTNASGFYEFLVCKGTYYIEFGNSEGYFRTFVNLGNDNFDSDANQATGRTHNFTLTPGQIDFSVDAGYYRLAAIGDFVWLDINANGIQNFGELGIPGVVVSMTGILADNSLVPPVAQFTGPNGEYLFSGLIPGRYIVVVGKPANFNFSPNDQGGNDTVDSDSNPLNGVMPEETLESGETNLTYDAGLYPPVNIELDKNFISAIVQPNGTFNVTYTIIVANTGGPGQYDLKDTPGFDSDITINSASYSSNAPGNPGGNLAGIGPWTLANDQPVSALTTHTYTLFVNVSLNLVDNIGDNTYRKCGSTTQTPISGEGLFNKASVDINNDGIPEDEAEDCGDIPNITMVKNFVSVAPNANPNG